MVNGQCGNRLLRGRTSIIIRRQQSGRSDNLKEGMPGVAHVFIIVKDGDEDHFLIGRGEDVPKMATGGGDRHDHSMYTSDPRVKCLRRRQMEMIKGLRVIDLISGPRVRLVIAISFFFFFFLSLSSLQFLIFTFFSLSKFVLFSFLISLSSCFFQISPLFLIFHQFPCSSLLMLSYSPPPLPLPLYPFFFFLFLFRINLRLSFLSIFA